MLTLRLCNASRSENAGAVKCVDMIMQSRSIRCRPSWPYTRVSEGLRSCRIQEGQVLNQND